MYALIDNTIDELITRARRYDAVADMAFLTAFPPDQTPNPIDRFTTAVICKDVKKSQLFIGNAVGRDRNGSIYDVDLLLRVYAPRNAASFALLRKTALLADALEAADTDGAIAAISLGRVVYESAAHTVYRELQVDLRWLLSGEGTA